MLEDHGNSAALLIGPQSPGENRKGGNLDSEVTDWESQRSGDTPNSVAVTSWNNQEFSDAIRKVNFLSGMLAGLSRNSATFGTLVLTRWKNQELSGTAWEACLIFD